jgi:hypothetical protein
MGLDGPCMDALQRTGFICCKDLLSKTKIKLIDILDMDEHTIDYLLNVVYQSCCPEPKTVASMRANNSALGSIGSYLPTQIRRPLLLALRFHSRCQADGARFGPGT